MANAVALQELEEVREPFPSNYPDAAQWQNWQVEDPPRRPGDPASAKTLQWALIVVLLALGGQWSRVTPFELMARFTLTAGAVTVVAQSLLGRRHAVGAVCGAIVLLDNPLTPFA